MRTQRAQKDAAELKAREEESQRREEEVKRLKDMDEAAKLNSVLDAIRDGGYPTLHSFVTALINIRGGGENISTVWFCRAGCRLRIGAITELGVLIQRRDVLSNKNGVLYKPI